MLPQSRTLENRNHMNAIPSPLSRPFIDASSGPDLGRRSDADAEGGAFGRLMRQQAMESAESKTAPRGGSSGSVPARSVARVGARDDSVYGEPGSPALADAGDAPNAAEAASDSQSDLVWDTHTPLEKPAKEDLPVDTAAGTGPGPAPTVPVYLMAIGATAESVQTISCAKPESLSALSIDMRAGPLPRTVARTAAASGGLSVDTATGTNPSPAPTLRSPPLVLGEATDAMQPTVGAAPESQGTPSSDGRTAPLPQTVARAAAASGGLPIDAAAGTNPSPAPTLRSPPLVLGEAAASMQSTSAADPAPAFRSSPLGIGEAAASMQPRSGADANDLDSPKPASTPEIGSISAQIQRLMHAGVDPVRTDGWGVVAPAGADATSQLNAVGTTPPSTAQMSTPAGAPGWGDELAQRTLWLVGQRGSVAELRLDPPELGSLEIRIRQKKDATSISFVVQSSSAREAVESTLPRLRELFAEAGLSLQSMDVSERQSGARRGDEGDRGTGGDTGLAESRFADGEPAPRTLWRGRGLIDTYA